jgi:hypothetical protein
VIALALLVVSAQSAAQEPIAAVWQARNLSFIYSSATSIYSCSALRGRVASILRAVGARDDLQVRVNDCSEAHAPPDVGMNTRGGRPTEIRSDRFLNPSTDRQLAHVSVRMMMPTEVTPDVLAELKKDKSRRELVSHVTGNPVARFNDPILFAAQWQPVTLSRKTVGLEPEECELVEQMSASFFRELGVRVVRKSATCGRNQVSHIPPELVVEALLATPYGTGSPSPAPAAGKEDAAEPSEPAASDDDLADPAADKTSQ